MCKTNLLKHYPGPVSRIFYSDFTGKIMTHENNSRKLTDNLCKIITVRQLSEYGFIHEYESPYIAKNAKPGQFVQVRPNPTYTPLLRRPFSVLTTNPEKGTISILFKVFGEGTKQLSAKRAGEEVAVLGPLGNSFAVDGYDKLVLAGGGIGIPPMYFLCESLRNSDKNIKVYFGAQTKDELWLHDEIRKTGVNLIVSTDDGSMGNRGFLTKPLEVDLKDPEWKSGTLICACGPMPMLSEVQRISKELKIPAQLSVETIMACGFGICMGCVLPNQDGTGFSLVCMDGPVFNENDLEI